MVSSIEGKRCGRSAFIRRSVQQYLAWLRIRELEEQHRAGYERRPVRAGEFDVWRREQDWGRP